MKKSLLALAVLGAFAGAAQAQSSVTVYGSIDGGVRHLTNTTAAGGNSLTMSSTGTYNSNRLGFRGVEDLGGGMKARFTLENGFNNGTGALDAANTLFNRTAAVGVGGDWGWLDLGRQYTVAFQTIGSYEPFSYKYPGITGVAGTATVGVRFSNDIKYTGTFGPVTVRAEYALGETAGSASTGSTSSLGGTYAAGPLSVGAAYTTRNLGGSLDLDHYTLGGAYKFGPARVTIGHANQQTDVTTATDNETKMTWIGLNYAVSPAVEVTTAFYQTKDDLTTGTGKRNFFIVGGTYALSKRTNFYAGIDQAKLSGTRISATGQTRNRGISLGINHLF